ncbi:MAG: DNA gyrase subunit A, partial [Christensenella sp.]
MKSKQIDFKEDIIEAALNEVMHNSYMTYAEYVTMERALPRVEDGLKPVQRRILYTMYDLGILPDKPYKKSARIVGEALGKYHPHGDTSVYDAMVRLAQPYAMRMPLVDGHGNFGSMDGDSAAAMRYTEARLSPLALEMLRDLNKDTVAFRPNFDDTEREPDMLPARFPNLLVNGSSGIAVGLATNIPPHNLGEVIDGVVTRIDNPLCSLQDITKHIKAPDFPTGGYILGGDGLQQAYETGKGKILVRAKTHIEKTKTGKNLIVITEVPYEVKKSVMLEKILAVSEN